MTGSLKQIPGRFARECQKSSEQGRMAQLVVPTGYFVEFPHGRMAQLVEHIVHIDGVTGSSPVATTTNP